MRSISTLAITFGLVTASLTGSALIGDESVARADDRADAKTHYQAGTRLYASADYRGAIKEFSAAQALVPADLNNYNLGLCYDKLGEADTAIQYYRVYLDRVPGTDRRSEIEASISRLDAASKSMAEKKAAEKAAADAKSAADAKAAAEAKAAADRAAEAAKNAEPPVVQPTLPAGPAVMPGVPTAPMPPVDHVSSGGSTGVPGNGVTVRTGDRGLDRASEIDISQIRDQRVGGATSGMPDTHAGPGGPNPTPNNLNGQVADHDRGAAPPMAGAGASGTPPADQPKPATVEPVYKKWWFWAVIGVATIVVYEIATDNSSSSNTGRIGAAARERGTVLPLGTIGSSRITAEPGGLTLHF